MEISILKSLVKFNLLVYPKAAFTAYCKYDVTLSFPAFPSDFKLATAVGKSCLMPSYFASVFLQDGNAVISA